MSIDAQSVQDIIIAITVIGGSWGFYRARKPSQDTNKRIETLQGLVEDYEKRIKLLEEGKKEDAQLHIDNAKAIADLQGQIKVYKELPLRELADGIARLNTGQDKMLSAIEKNGISASASADIAQADTNQVAKTLRNS